MRCANTRALNNYEREIDKAEKEQEKIELEFYDAISSLKDYAIKMDCLELLREVVAEELNLLVKK